MTVRNWEFFQPAGVSGVGMGLGGEIDPLRLLKRRGSLVVADLPAVTADMVAHHQQQQREQEQQKQAVPAEMKSGGHLPKQKQQQQKAAAPAFEEPDANSLLDSFGF